ncbi:MAG: transporter substrate-binding domain-containing protein [Synergistaceae bacterium]|nr:transporter substrate-binding domain-containing protein [Synergistaceae bacterium]
MKKIILALIFMIALTGSSFSAERRLIRLGLLSKLNSTEEIFSDTWKKKFAPHNEVLEVRIKFYDSLTSMLLGLESGEIMQMVLPHASAEYVLSQNQNYESVLVLNSGNMGLAFGFREDSKELRDKFNDALRFMRNNWILPTLEGIYTASVGISGEPEPVDFEKFKGADTIKVAVTGDLPPIDYIAPDGTPMGFNTAVLSEIGSYLKKNIELVEVDSGARTSALASGRADVVFWYEVDTSAGVQHDVPEGVILSEPYYTWNKFIHIRKVPAGGSSRNWNIKRDILGLYNW